MHIPLARHGSGPASLLLLGGAGCLLASSFAGTGDARAAWSGETQDRQISFDDNEYARGVQVALDPVSLSLHSTWMEDSPSTREVLYGRSTDGGATWSSETGDRQISLPDGNAAYEETAMAVGDGLLIVVWSEDLFGTREVHYGISTDDGVTFTSETNEVVLSDPNTEVDTSVPSVLVEADNTIHVVWHQSAGETAEICYSRSTDGGLSWTGTSGDRVISFPDGNAATEPKLLLGDGGRLLVVWRETSDLGGRVLQVGISDDGGDTWSSETADREISQPVNIMTVMDAASSTFGSSEMHAVYAGSFDESSPFHYETYVTTSTDNGDTWSGETGTTAVSFDEDHSRSTSNPTVFLSRCGGAIAAWNEEAEPFGTAEIHISELTGGVWSGATSDIVVSFPDGENGYRPAIVGVDEAVILPAPGRGELAADTWILWTEFEGGTSDNYEVHLSAELRCDASSVPEPLTETSRLSLAATPNPSAGPVRIELALADAEDRGPGAGAAGRVEVFDASGRQVFGRPVTLESGRAVLSWDPAGSRETVPAGVYFVRARFGEAEQVRTIVLQ